MSPCVGINLHEQVVGVLESQRLLSLKQVATFKQRVEPQHVVAFLYSVHFLNVLHQISTQLGRQVFENTVA